MNSKTTSKSPTPSRPEPKVADIGQIVIGEPQAGFWPTTLVDHKYGVVDKHHRFFAIGLSYLRKLKPGLSWVPFFKSEFHDFNEIKQHPTLISAMSNLFRAELSADFSESQLKILAEADCVLVGFDTASRRIVAFGSTRFTQKGVLVNAGLYSRIAHGGLLVVSEKYAKAKLGIIIASTIALYGHSTRTVLSREIAVVRLNNKHLEKVFKRAGRIYRLDHMVEGEKDPEKIEAIRAMAWTHYNVFHLQETPFKIGEPIPIEHSFPPNVTMSNMEVNQITYVVRSGSLARLVFMVFVKSFRRRKSLEAGLMQQQKSESLS